MKKLMFLGTLASALIITSCEKEELTPAKQVKQPTEVVDSSNARQNNPPEWKVHMLLNMGEEWMITKKLSTYLWVMGGGQAPPGQGMDEYFHENASELIAILDDPHINGVISGSLTVSGVGDHNLPVGSTYQLLFHDVSGVLVAGYEYEIVAN